jgi:lysophospholipase L1-like esterase
MKDIKFMKPILLVAATAVFFLACSEKSGNGPSGFDAAIGGTGGSSGTSGIEGLSGSGGTSGIGSGGTAATTDSSVGGGTGGTSGIGGTGGVSGVGGSTMIDGGPDGSPLFDSGTDVVSTGDTGPATGDAGTYQPCPTNGDLCKILPLGDSITWGVGDVANAGYRSQLFALAVAAGQKITFTGSKSNGPDTVSGQLFPKQNDGREGWRIQTPSAMSNGQAGIRVLIPDPAFAATSGGIPNIILMMIGTNDTDDTTADTMAQQLDSLMSLIIDNAPDALLVVAKITPKSWTAAAVNGYNALIPGLVQKYADAGKHVMLADMNTGFIEATMMSDDHLHPNSTGYKFMADQWYSVIGSFLPK